MKKWKKLNQLKQIKIKQNLKKKKKEKNGRINKQIIKNMKNWIQYIFWYTFLTNYYMWLATMID